MGRRHDPSADLLFGLLALQVGLIDQSQLVTAFQAWSREKAGRALAEIFVARADLDAEQRDLLDGLVTQHRKRHGDAERSLAAMTSVDALAITHYYVTAAGAIYQLVDDANAAWHAGMA